MCLNVDLLKTFEPASARYSFLIPRPSLCSALVTSTLLKKIDEGLQLIELNGLIEVVYKIEDINWFSSLDDLIYQKINTNLHITNGAIYFSGAFAPEKLPVFVSKRLPLSSVMTRDFTKPKELNLSLLSSEAAIVLIQEIKQLEKELNIALDRQYSLDDLDNALNKLTSASVISESTSTSALAYEVSAEIKMLSIANEKLESYIDEKCKILCKQILGIGIGDYIVTQSHFQNNIIEIQITSARYHDGVIYLDGPKVLKSGELGKRTETASITLVNKDEHL